LAPEVLEALRELSAGIGAIGEGEHVATLSCAGRRAQVLSRAVQQPLCRRCGAWDSPQGTALARCLAAMEVLMSLDESRLTADVPPTSGGRVSGVLAFRCG
jgi:hypothetical protein